MLEMALPFTFLFALFCGMVWKIWRNGRPVPRAITAVFVLTLFVVALSMAGLFFGLARS